MPKKKATKAVGKKATKAVGKKDAPEKRVPLAKFELNFPPGTRESVTLLLRGGPSVGSRGLLSSSARGMTVAAIKAQEEERLRRALPPEERAKLDRKKKKMNLNELLGEEVAELAAYLTEDGRFYHPARGFLSAMIDGLRVSEAIMPGTKKGAATIFGGLVRVEHDHAILLNPKTMRAFKQGKDNLHHPYEIDFRTACNKQGNRIPTWRAFWKEWATVVNFSYDPAILEEAVVVQAAEVAGQLVGVGGFRLYPPLNGMKRSNPGPFGGFVVEKVLKLVPKEAQWMR